MTSEKHKRKQIDSQARAMITSVYHFLREEYDFMKQNNYENCDLSLLSNITKRTAQATGVSERTVSRLLREERESSLKSTTEKLAPKKKRTKESKAKKKLQISSDNSVGVSTLEELWASKGSIVAIDHTVLDVPYQEELTPQHLAVCNRPIKMENKLRKELFSDLNLIADNNNELMTKLDSKLREELSSESGHFEQYNNLLNLASSEGDQAKNLKNVDNFVTLQSIKPEYCKDTGETFLNNSFTSLTVLA